MDESDDEDYIGGAAGSSAPPLEPAEQKDSGPIKEHLLGEVYQRRQQTRDQPQDAGDRAQFEQDNPDKGPQEKEKYDWLDGEEISAFNMEGEGYDEESGVFKRSRDEESELAKDPWLLSLQHEQAEAEEEDDGGNVTHKVRRRQEVISDKVAAERSRQEAAAAAAQPLSDNELHEARLVLLEHLQPRESVMDALKRLSGKPKGPQVSRGKRPQQQRTPEDAARRALIERYTDAASSVLSVEADIFEQRREEIEHVTRMHAIEHGGGAGPAKQSGGATGNPASQALTPGGGGDDSDDLFDNDSDDGGRPGAAEGSGSGAAAAVAAASHPMTASTTAASSDAADAHSGGGVAEGSAAVSAGDSEATRVAGSVVGGSSVGGAAGGGPCYSDWPVAELRRVLREAGVDISDVVEKRDLIAKMEDLDRQAEANVVPLGFVMQESGYYFNAETQWYFDGSSGLYFKDGNWYQWDPGSGQYVKWA